MCGIMFFLLGEKTVKSKLQSPVSPPMVAFRACNPKADHMQLWGFSWEKNHAVKRVYTTIRKAKDCKKTAVSLN